jgi:hypothetical protein
VAIRSASQALRHDEEPTLVAEPERRRLHDATPKGLAQLMRTIAQSPEEVRRCGANARELIDRTLNWEHKAAKLTDQCDRLTPRSTAPN